LNHLEKLLFVLQFNIITVHTDRNDQEEKTGHEHKILILLLHTVEVNHEGATEDQADTGLQPVRRYEGRCQVTDLCEADNKREVLALLRVKPRVVECETCKRKDNHTRVVLLEMGHPLTQNYVGVMQQCREHEASQPSVANAITKKHLDYQHSDVYKPRPDN